MFQIGTNEEQQTQEIWCETFDDSDDEDLDDSYSYTQNLGAESPYYTSTLTPKSPSAHSPRILPTTFPVQADGGPTRQRIWRSLSFDRKKRALASNKARSKSRSSSQQRTQGLESDCGICFTLARKPARTSCCGTIFCYEHIADWLHGLPEGRCPACNSPCSLSSHVRRLPSSSRGSRVATPGSMTPASPSFSHLPADVLSSPLSLSCRGSFIRPSHGAPSDITPPPAYEQAPDYDSSDSSEDESSHDDSRSSWGTGSSQDEEIMEKSSKNHSTSLEAELYSKVFTLMGLGLVLYLLFHGRTSEKPIQFVET